MRAPAFDRLYDCAQALEGAELVLELRESAGALRGALWLELRELDDSRTVHELRVEATVDAAAAQMIDRVESDAADV